MDNPEKLATQGTQYEENHNTICAGQHYALTYTHVNTHNSTTQKTKKVR